MKGILTGTAVITFILALTFTLASLAEQRVILFVVALICFAIGLRCVIALHERTAVHV